MSGGGDSTALLLLLSDVAAEQGRALIAGVVDHALRQGSDADAARAADIAAGLGAEPHVVRLDWPEGPRTAQAAARVARYAALAGLARRVGASTLFLGHTRDDQAETILMRMDAGSGARGMAGMAPLSPCPIWPEGRDLQLARPLLGWRREALRDVLRAAGARWIEDPANGLPRYARVRARAHLSASGDGDRWASAAHANAVATGCKERAAQAFLQAQVTITGETAALRRVSGDEDCIRALEVLATAVGGSAREPSPAAAARLAARLMAGQDGTLAGARFRAGNPVRVTRDPGGLTGRRGGGKPVAPLELPAAETAVWDGRLALTAPDAGWTVGLDPGSLTPALRYRAAPVSLDGAPVDARWLVSERVHRLLWRAGTVSATA